MAVKLFPAFAWLLVITFMSTKGGISMPEFNLFQMDKLGHAGAYGLLVWLILFGWTRFKPGRELPWSLGLRVFLIATIYGALMEFVQFRWFPDRHFEVDDMLANAVGAGLGWLSFKQIVQMRARK